MGLVCQANRLDIPVLTKKIFFDLLKSFDDFIRRVKEGLMAKLKAGEKAPDFQLEDQNGKKVKLTDFRRRKLLLYFYSKADTPG